MRQSWDSYFLDIAEIVGGRATCDRANVGCVITKDNRIISTGFNGSIRGHAHCDDVGHLLNEEGRCIRTIHAEQNALLHAKETMEGATAYITHEPCETCAKLLNQAGISRVVYISSYSNGHNEHFMEGMEVVKEGEEVWEF